MKTIILRLTVFAAIVLFCVACLTAFFYGAYRILHFILPTPEAWSRLDLSLQNHWLFFGIFMAPLWVLAMIDFWQFLKARKRFSISLSFLFVPLLQAGVIAFSYLIILFFSVNYWTAGLLLGTIVSYILFHKRINRIKGHIDYLDWLATRGLNRPTL